MEIKHAAWPTPAPPVCTAFWDQSAWDKFAEGYRPAGYTGGIYDDKAYMIWGAQLVVDKGREAEKILRLAWPCDSVLLHVREVAARLNDALAAANVCRESRRTKYRASYCELGTCFVCTVARLARGER